MPGGIHASMPLLILASDPSDSLLVCLTGRTDAFRKQLAWCLNIQEVLQQNEGGEISPRENGEYGEILCENGENGKIIFYIMARIGTASLWCWLIAFRQGHKECA
jgi:hypothetical protein